MRSTIKTQSSILIMLFNAQLFDSFAMNIGGFFEMFYIQNVFLPHDTQDYNTAHSECPFNWLLRLIITNDSAQLETPSNNYSTRIPHKVISATLDTIYVTPVNHKTLDPSKSVAAQRARRQTLQYKRITAGLVRSIPASLGRRKRTWCSIRPISPAAVEGSCANRNLNYRKCTPLSGNWPAPDQLRRSAILYTYRAFLASI